MADTYTNKNGITKTWKETGTKKATDSVYSSESDAKSAWNAAVTAKANEAAKAGKNVFWSEDSNGYKHYSTVSQSKADAITGSYDTGGSSKYVMDGLNYTYAAPDVKDTSLSTMTSYINSTLGNPERIKSYYDEYLPAMMQSGKAQADKSYEANANAALNKRTEALKQYKENYINNVLDKRNQLESVRAGKDAQLNAISDDYFAILQQNRENSAARGLSNSGLMQALDQNIMSEANAQRAAIDQQYYANVNQLNREISTLVETYGLNKAEADKIYNDTIQSLEQQRQNDYQKIVAEAQQKAIEYEFGVDSFNAGAANDFTKSRAELVTDAWKTKVNAETELEGDKLAAETSRENAKLESETSIHNAQLDSDTKLETAKINAKTQVTLAEIAANTDMSIAELQDATDRWKASLDSEDKRWLAKFDRNTQIKIATLNNDARERLAQIEGSLGMAAAKYAADLEYQATMTGLNMQAGWQEKLIDAMKSAGYFGGSGGTGGGTGGGNFASPNLFETPSNMFAGVGGLITAR